jgi:hypothetical protein
MMRLTTLMLLMIIAFVLATCCPAPQAATCYGNTPCNACKNCHYCKHCAHQGGTCGICKR